MLPKNKLGRKVLKNMKVYAGAEHPHTAQKTMAMAPRLNEELNNVYEIHSFDW